MDFIKGMVDCVDHMLQDSHDSTDWNVHTYFKKKGFATDMTGVKYFTKLVLHLHQDG